MARPIRNTPILYGEDAKRFLADIAQLPPIEERRRERARIEQSVNELMALVAKHKEAKTIILRSVTDAERQRLRIPSYKYLLP